MSKQVALLLIITGLLLSACRPVTAPPATVATSVATVESPAPSTVQVVKPAVTASTVTPETLAGAPGIIEPQGFIQRIHDPVIAKEGDTYYVFSTGAKVIVICSKDMVNWEWCGRVFEKAPTWLFQVNHDINDLWAPDISYFNDRWHLYYAGSSMGSQNSVIALATNKTLDPNSPDYAWVDEGEVLRSHPGGDWNAIDPNLVIDADGQTWLAYGSYWSGIKLRKIDPATGKLATDDETVYALADRRVTGDDSIEGAFIIRHGDYYYLFASFDHCCQGAESTYNVRVGRSASITGPYLDRDGVPMLEGGGTKILAAYGQWRGPGHNGFLQEDGIDWMVYHAYDAQQIGISKLRIEAVQWDADGWPSLLSQSPK